MFQNLREAFRIFDKDRSGYIEAKEIISVTTTLGQALSEDELREALEGRGVDVSRYPDKQKLVEKALML